MKRLFLMLAALAVISSTGLTPAVAAPATLDTSEPTPPPKQSCGTMKSKWQQKQCQAYNNSAPADEYFGRLKMSYIGINNTYHDMAIESGDSTTNSNIITKLGFANEALAKWAAKYPKDPELARSYYLGVLALRKVYVQQMQVLAWQFIQTIQKQFPNTYFSKQAKQIAQAGFVQHWYGDPQPCPALGVDPSPSPDPSPKPGGVVVAVLDPPCIQPPPQDQPTPPQPVSTTTPAPAPTKTKAP